MTATTVALETLPAATTDLWLLQALFLADWSQKVAIHSVYETDVQYGLTAREQRRGLRGYPYRTLGLTLMGVGPDETLLLKTLAMRASMARGLFPIACDLTPLTAACTTGATTLACDTTLRRFYPGTRAVIYANGSTSGAPFEVVSISGITATTLTVSATANAYGVGAVVMPLVEGRAIFKSAGIAKSDTCSTLALEATESIGPAQLPGTTAPGVLPGTYSTAPGTWATYLGYPIPPLKVDFGTRPGWGFERYGAFSASGIDFIPAPFGARGRGTFNLATTAMDRAAAWTVVNLFDYCAGRMLPFWLANPQTLYRPISASTTGLVLAAVGSLVDWTLRPYVAIELLDGTVAVRTVTAARAAGHDTLTFDSPIVGLTNATVLARVTDAVLVRFNKDELVEEWMTDNTMACTLDLVEVSPEGAVTIANVVDVKDSGTDYAGFTTAPAQCMPAPCGCPGGLTGTYTVHLPAGTSDGAWGISWDAQTIANIPNNPHPQTNCWWTPGPVSIRPYWSGGGMSSQIYLSTPASYQISESSMTWQDPTITDPNDRSQWHCYWVYSTGMFFAIKRGGNDPTGTYTIVASISAVGNVTLAGGAQITVSAP